MKILDSLYVSALKKDNEDLLQENKDLEDEVARLDRVIEKRSALIHRLCQDKLNLHNSLFRMEDEISMQNIQIKSQEQAIRIRDEYIDYLNKKIHALENQYHSADEIFRKFNVPTEPKKEIKWTDQVPFDQD